MKVLVVNTMAPFVWGGAEELAANLVTNLKRHGHNAELMRIPFRHNPQAVLLQQMAMIRAMEVTNTDRLITLKFPTFLLRHPHKTVWLLHQFRQAYDLFDAGHSHIAADGVGHSVRDMILRAETESLTEARTLLTNSPVTSDRLLRYNGVQSETLRPPLNDPEMFAGGAPEGYIFAGGRVNWLKRQRLLIEGLARSNANVRLIIAGPAEESGTERELVSLADSLGVLDRLRLDLRLLSRAEYAAYVNGATACAYIPFDEDSLGYVAMEAAAAGKPLITTSDSGGVRDLVLHGHTGWIAEPTAEGLGRAMTEALRRPSRTLKRGMAARAHLRGMGLTWDNTIERLLS